MADDAQNESLVLYAVITIIVLALSVEQYKIVYSFSYCVSDCSSNYKVPSIVNNQWGWNQSQSDWFRDQEWIYAGSQDDKTISTDAFCLMGTQKCLNLDKLTQLDNLIVDKSAYPEGYFNLLYNSIKYVNYLSFVDFVTSIIAGVCCPILLLNIWIETFIEMISIDTTQKLSSDTLNWALLWPGCKGMKLSY